MEIEKVMEMSLDEYIDNTKSNNASNNNNVGCNGSNFKAERHKYLTGDDEEEEVGVLVGDEEDLGIWKGPDARTNYLDLHYEKDDFDQMFDELSTEQSKNQTKQQQQGNKNQNGTGGRFDLRERISGSSGIPPQSQQWRLMAPNVGNQRPAGMPPLVPQQDVNNRRQNRNRRQRWGNRDNGGFGNRGQNGGYNNGGGGNRNQSGGNNNYRNNGGGYNNNGRVQRINQQQQQQYSNNQQMLLNQSLKAVLDKLNCSNMPMSSPQVTIEVPSDSLDLRPPPPTNFNYGRNTATAAASRAPMTPAAIAAHNLQNKNDYTAPPNFGAEGIKSLLGIGQSVNNEMMPMLASKFLDLFQNCSQQTVHKPMYDMKLQKEIHDLQKKSLMYSCPGGEVVSSDGSGINNCEIIPRTSGVSMNYRFA